jgi:hypothetical protein
VHEKLERQEINANRYRKMVQSDEGLWIHSAPGWRKDVFAHISAVERAGLSTLNEVKPSNAKKLRTEAGRLRRTLGFNAELVSAGASRLL